MTDLDKRIEQWYLKQKSKEIEAMIELLNFKFDFSDMLKVVNACNKYGLSNIVQNLPFTFISNSQNTLDSIIYKPEKCLAFKLEIYSTPTRNYVTLIRGSRPVNKSNYIYFYDLLTDFTNNYKRIEYEFFKSVEEAIKC